MKRMCLSGSEQAPVLVEEQVPEPRPGRGEILVRVHAAGVTPSEILWYPTTHTKSGQLRTHAVPGHEFAGVIAAVGPDVEGVAPAQAVYGMNDWFADGATADFCITQPSSVADKPRSLTDVEAASVPIGALTAWQGLFERARLRAGDNVLVHGGSGAVGAFAVQLARIRGARVTATASARNREFVLQLGAERVIDYHSERFEDQLRDIDVVFDTVGGDTLRRSWAVLGSNGRMVTIAADGEQTNDARVKEAFFIVEPNRPQLIEIGRLLDNKQLRPVVDAVIPFSRAGDAYGGRVEDRQGRGKMVIAIAETGNSAVAQVPADPS